jgi:hypothetical protein
MRQRYSGHAGTSTRLRRSPNTLWQRGKDSDSRECRPQWRRARSRDHGRLGQYEISSRPVQSAIGASIPSPFAPTRLERLAREIATPEQSLDELADWLRGYLRSEIERRLRAETNGHENHVEVACAKWEISIRSAGARRSSEWPQLAGRRCAMTVGIRSLSRTSRNAVGPLLGFPIGATPLPAPPRIGCPSPCLRRCASRAYLVRVYIHATNRESAGQPPNRIPQGEGRGDAKD